MKPNEQFWWNPDGANYRSGCSDYSAGSVANFRWKKEPITTDREALNKAIENTKDQLEKLIQLTATVHTTSQTMDPGSLAGRYQDLKALEEIKAQEEEKQQ